MKRTIFVTLLMGISLISFCQKAKLGDNTKQQSKKVHPVAPGPDLKDGPQPGTTVFVLNPDQVRLLEYVINESQAGYKDVRTLLSILQTQQYRPPADTTSKIPPVKTDSTAVKKN